MINLFVPVIQTKDKNKNQVKKLLVVNSKYWKGNNSYKKLQDNFYKYIVENGFDLER
ncbi:MAG: hypothetical protein HFJ20_05670 [Clostridia bacterium]|nr:hypothetical protein [Clostridia bacterium]